MPPVTVILLHETHKHFTRSRAKVLSEETVTVVVKRNRLFSNIFLKNPVSKLPSLKRRTQKRSPACRKRGAGWLQCCVTSSHAHYVTFAPTVCRAEVVGAAKWAHLSENAHVRGVINSRAVTSCESTARLPPDLQDLCEHHHVLHARFFFLSLFDINIST